MAWSTGAPEPYDMLADRERTLAALARDPEVDRLAGEIDPANMGSIMTFGREPARAIGRTADDLLRGMGPGLTHDPGDLLEDLAGVMGRVDAEDEAPKPGLLGRLLGGKRPPEDRLSHYDALGADLDRVYVGLKAYSAQLNRDNRRLEQLFQANLEYFHALEKYVAAGEKARRALAARLSRTEAALARAGEGALSFEAQTLRSAADALERRVQDLRAAEAVAMQCIPMIRVLQLNNRELSDRIDAAFIATLPAFRREMALAVAQRRERLKGEAAGALSARAGARRLEESRRAVLDGIGQTRELSQKAAAQSAGQLERLRKARGE